MKKYLFKKSGKKNTTCILLAKTSKKNFLPIKKWAKIIDKIKTSTPPSYLDQNFMLQETRNQFCLALCTPTQSK